MSIEAFDYILLEDTFVFSWHLSTDTLTFQVLASLSQAHPAATVPAAGEWACYRSGAIEFSRVSAIRGLQSQESVVPTTDPDGSVDYGTIDGLAQIGPGEYR
ncbi:hypothetical protein GCM10022229_22350 [Luteimonas lutimaris]|uniref:Uncharacterized protein n=1 Tax=Luteimonas lutimaris TaxID=698645 RepID=A0ABP7MQA6_9GAMM